MNGPVKLDWNLGISDFKRSFSKESLEFCKIPLLQRLQYIFPTVSWARVTLWLVFFFNNLCSQSRKVLAKPFDTPVNLKIGCWWIKGNHCLKLGLLYFENVWNKNINFFVILHLAYIFQAKSIHSYFL